MDTRGGPVPLPVAFFLLFFSGAGLSSPTATDVTNELLIVPFNDFVSVLQSAMSEIQSVLSIISQFSGSFGDVRLSNAIDDCVDLLDFSADELGYSLSATGNANGKVDGAGTGDPRSDLSTWLSAAFSNQDTCLDGFESTDGIAKELVAGGLYQVTSLVGEMLNMIRQVPGQQGGVSSTSRGRKTLQKEVVFPDWVTVGSRRLLQTPVGGMKWTRRWRRTARGTTRR